MKKKALALFLIVLMTLTFITLKKRYSTTSVDKSEFINFTWNMNPLNITDLNKPVMFTFDLKDKDNKPIVDAKISIEANMNHAGMTPIYTQATHDKNGLYKTTLKLNMDGDWILFLTIAKTDTVIIKKEIMFATHQKQNVTD